MSVWRPWESRHAGLCLAAGALGVGLRTTAPLVVLGTGSLVVFLASRGHRGIANAVTLLRLIILGVVALFWPSAWGFAAVLVLDGLDGFLARRFKETSAFGAQFDMETDALFIGVLSVELMVRGAPAWVLVAGALRPVLVVTRLVFPRTAPGERRTFLGRYAFFVSAVCLLTAVEAQPVIRGALCAVAVAILVLSFSSDFRGLRR